MRIAVGLGRQRGEKELEASGVNRRDFMKFCTAVAVTMGFGPAFATDVAGRCVVVGGMRQGDYASRRVGGAAGQPRDGCAS